MRINSGFVYGLITVDYKWVVFFTSHIHTFQPFLNFIQDLKTQ